MIKTIVALCVSLFFVYAENCSGIVARQNLSFINRVKLRITGYVTPKMFGARGDGIADDTASIQDAINYASRNSIRVVRISQGTYNINISGHDINANDLIIDGESHYFDLIGAGLILKSNVNLVLDNKTTLQAIPSDISEYAVLYVGEQHDIRVSGGRIVGDYENHRGIEGQHGMCVWIQSSNNIVIDGCDISQGWGDCIAVGCKWNSSILPGSNRSRNITVSNCKLHNSRRQGISVVGCENLLIRNCHIYNISGIGPQAGIDLEVNFADYPNVKCVFDGVRIENCKGGGIIGYTTPTHGVIIRNSSIQSVQLTCVDDVNLLSSNVPYVTIDNYYDAPDDTVIIKESLIKTLTLYSGGYYDFIADNCIIGNDKEQPAVAFVNRKEGNNVSNAVNLQFVDCKLLAENEINLFSIVSSAFPNSILCTNCDFRFFKKTNVYANKVILNNCRLYGRSLTMEFFSPEVSMMNNTIETKDCFENINGYIYKFNSKKKVVFSYNKIVGSKKESQLVVIPREYTPDCEMNNNDALQYDSLGLIHNKVNIQANNNILQTK